MRIVVTGGAGFIGSTLVDRLLADGHSVDVIDDLSRGSLANLRAASESPRFAFHQVSVTDPGVTGLIAGLRPDAVCHLAAQIDVRVSVASPAEDALVNVVGSLRVADGARLGGAKTLVFTSSGGAVHGSIRPGEPAASEGAPRRPESPYGVAKMVVIDYLAVYRDLYGLDYAVIAPANVYGPRQDPFGEGGVVAIFAERLLSGRPCVIFGDGQQSRDFVHVSDVADAFVRAIGAGSGRVFNIGTGVETSVNELYAVMAEVAGVGGPAVREAARPGEAARSVLDPARAKAELGWTPRVTLADGVATVLDYVRSLG